MWNIFCKGTKAPFLENLIFKFLNNFLTTKKNFNFTLVLNKKNYYIVYFISWNCIATLPQSWKTYLKQVLLVYITKLQWNANQPSNVDCPSIQPSVGHPCCRVDHSNFVGSTHFTPGLMSLFIIYLSSIYDPIQAQLLAFWRLWP